MAKIKASALKRGDVIQVERWSNLWKRVAPTTATVMDIAVFGSNISIMAKAKDGLKEYITDIFVPSDTEYEMIALGGNGR